MSRPCHSLPPRKNPVPIVQGARCAPGPVWTGAENFAHTGIRSPIQVRNYFFVISWYQNLSVFYLNYSNDVETKYLQKEYDIGNK